MVGRPCGSLLFLPMLVCVLKTLKHAWEARWGQALLTNGWWGQTGIMYTTGVANGRRLVANRSRVEKSTAKTAIGTHCMLVSARGLFTLFTSRS